MPALRIRIGINTGEVVTGDDAATLATGDAVNTAKRLEEAAAAGEILIGAVDGAARAPCVPARAARRRGGEGQERCPSRRGACSRPSRAPTRSPAAGTRRSSGGRASSALLRDELTASADRRECRLVTVLGPAGVGKTRLVSELIAEVGGHATVAAGRCLSYGDGHHLLAADGAPRSGSAASRAVAGRLMRRRRRRRARRRAPRRARRERIDSRRRSSSGPCGACSRRSAGRGRCSFSSRTSTGPSRRCSISSSTSAAGAATRRSCSSASRGRSCSRSGRGGKARSCGSSRSRPTTRPTLLDALGGDAARCRRSSRARDRGGGGGQPALRRAARGDARRRRLPRPVELPPTIQALLAARLGPPRSATSGTCSSGRRSSARSSGAERSRPLSATGDAHARPDAARRSSARSSSAGRSSAPGDDGFRFRHALIRDAAYDRIPKGRRADLHERFADWLELQRRARDGDRRLPPRAGLPATAELGSLDDHTRSLGERARRAAHRRRASGRCARDDVPAAVNLLERGAALLPAGERLTRARAPRARRRADAIGRLRSRRRRARRGARPRRAPTATGGSSCAPSSSASSSGSSRMRRRPTRGDHPHRRGGDPGPRGAGDDAGVAKAWWLLSEPPVNACRWGERAAALEHALDYARRAGDAPRRLAPPRSWCRRSSSGRRRSTPPSSGLSSSCATSEGDRLLTASILSSLAVLLAMRGEFDEARAQWARARGLWDELGTAHNRAIRSIDGSTIELLAGDVDAALRELRTGGRMLEEIGDVHFPATIAAYLAAALAHGGRFTEAEEVARVRGVARLGGRHRHAGDVAGCERAGPGRRRSWPARRSSWRRRPTSSSSRRPRCSPSRESSARRAHRMRQAPQPKRRRSTSARGTSSARAGRHGSWKRRRHRSSVSAQRRWT